MIILTNFNLLVTFSNLFLKEIFEHSLAKENLKNNQRHFLK